MHSNLISYSLYSDKQFNNLYLNLFKLIRTRRLLIDDFSGSELRELLWPIESWMLDTELQDQRSRLDSHQLNLKITFNMRSRKEGIIQTQRRTWKGKQVEI
jgi:hypothetical protein